MPDRILPPLRRTAADAEAFARVVHAGQVDKAGRPYVEHLERVAHGAAWKAHLRSDPYDSSGSAEFVDQVKQIAWLHDVIEDTEHTSHDLMKEGFSPAVAYGVEYLTKESGVRYLDWIAGLCERALLPVLIVKLADMEDNSDPARLALLPETTRERLERKYREPIAMLRAAVERGAGR